MFPGGGNVFAAGCSDGSVRIFDRRLPSNNCRTITYRENAGVIINAKIRKCSDLLVAGLYVMVKFTLRWNKLSTICHFLFTFQYKWRC